MKMPAPRLIAVHAGSPALIAQSLRELYLVDGGRGGMATRIVPDDTSGTIIVRAEEDEFTQIKVLANALQQQASNQKKMEGGGEVPGEQLGLDPHNT